MKRIIPFILTVLLFLVLLFLVVACPGSKKPDTRVEKDINTFVSKNHGNISILPTYKYIGMKETDHGKGIRKYFVWEDTFTNKIIVILQLVPKEGIFPVTLDWTPTQGSLYIKGFRAAYNTVAEPTHKVITELGGILPDCFVLTQEVHVKPTEAVFRILIVPDKMCSEEYEKVMEELNRVAIINPLD